jgi:hypothetical protein
VVQGEERGTIAQAYRADWLVRGTVLGALCATLVAAGGVRPTSIPLASNKQASCTPTYLALWDGVHEVPTSWATWAGNVTLIGCLEQFDSLTLEERTRAQAAFDAAIQDEDLHFLRSSLDGPMRARIATRVNTAVGRVVVTDWLLQMARGEAI